MHVPLVIIWETAHGLHQETEAAEPDSGRMVTRESQHAESTRPALLSLWMGDFIYLHWSPQEYTQEAEKSHAILTSAAS